MKSAFPKRIIIFTQDVKNITGKSARTARNLLRDIRQSLNKDKNQFITIKEFCQYTGLKEEDVGKFIIK